MNYHLIFFLKQDYKGIKKKKKSIYHLIKKNNKKNKNFHLLVMG